MGRNARKPKTPEGDTASGASQRKADAIVVGTGKRKEDVCFSKRYSRWNSGKRGDGKGGGKGG